MTGPIIPADQWPDAAVALVWSKSGAGTWWIATDAGLWTSRASNVPMPSGHDWRVPVMRPRAEGALDALEATAPPERPRGEVSDADIKWDLRLIESHLKDVDAAVPVLLQGVRKVIQRSVAQRAAAIDRDRLLAALERAAAAETELARLRDQQPAPAIDLELVREAVEAAIAHAGPNDGSLAGWQRLLALIDGQPTKGEGE